MSNTINSVRVFGLLGAIALFIYPFIDVASTFANGGMCGTGTGC